MHTIEHLDELVSEATGELNAALADFDRWLSQNVAQDIQSDPTFRLKRQTIKLLRIQVHDLLVMRDRYVQDDYVLNSESLVRYPDGNFTKPKNNSVSNDYREGAKVGGRKHLKVSTS